MASLRVTQYPHSPSNAYQALIANELGHLGLRMDFAETLVDLCRRILGRSTDVVHIHWTHVPRGYGRLKALARYLAFVLVLCAARLTGIGIVWTLHNSRNHDCSKPLLEWLFASTTGALAHRVIVQGPVGARVASEWFKVRRHKIATVKHGNYAPIIEPCDPPEGSRTQRFLAWGQIRAYKGFGDLALEFARMGLDAELVICGMPMDAGEAARLSEIAMQSPKVAFRPGYLSDAELSREICRADFVVLPFRDVLTSGSLLMCLTAGRPVIVPRLGDLEAYVDETAAIFYDPDDALGVFRAIESACSIGRDALEQMCAAALRTSAEQSLEIAASLTREEYLKARAHRSRGRQAAGQGDLGPSFDD